MRELQTTINFRCDHKEINTVKFEDKTIRSRIKRWTCSKNRTSASPCSSCSDNIRRSAPPARGTSQTVAAVALGGQGHSVPALQAVQTRWAEIANLSRSSSIEEFSTQHQVLATEAEHTLDRIDQFWRSVHAKHVVRIHPTILSSSDRGPDAGPLCHVCLQSVLDGQHPVDREPECNVLDCNCDNCSRKAVEQALARNGLDVQQEGQSSLSQRSHHRKRNNLTPKEIRRRFTRRLSRKSRHHKVVWKQLSIILEENNDT